MQLEGVFMRRVILIAILLGLCVGVADLSAKDNQTKYKYAEVKHFTNVEVVGMPQDFAIDFHNRFSAQLVKEKVVAQTIEEGAAVPAEDAADSIVIEGKFTEFNKSGRCALKKCDGHIGYEINIYRKSDHSLIAAITHVTSSRGEFTGHYWASGGGVVDSILEATSLIKKALK
jgi:hypothetical protein